ncbi:MAG: hypothetical protein KJO12_05550 [Ignavibacteria bacterium]|nr:hypothetical protein [Ignavibacteria bacterium]
MKKLLIILIMPFILTSCLNYYQEVKLAIDGSGSMHVDYWMLLPDDESASVVSKIGIFTPDSIKKEFTSKHSIVENVVVYQDTTDSTTHAVLDLKFTHIDSLNSTKTFSDAQFSFKEGAAGHIVFSQFIPPIATGFGIDGSAYHVRYQYTFSGDIITHNAHSSSGRTLIWLYALSEIGGGKTISVTFRPFKLKETPAWIFILSGFVLLLVIFFLIRKKKS